MPIIKTTKGAAAYSSMYFNYPDQFVSDKEKQKDDWIKMSMDYWYTVGMGQCTKKKAKVVRNYKLVNGFLEKEDFYQEYRGDVVPEAGDLLDAIEQTGGMPAHIQNYNIISTPLNILVGEDSKRPDYAYIRAMDDESLGEKQQAMTDLFQQYMEQKIREKVIVKLQARGADTEDLEAYEEQVNKLTEEQMVKYATSISTQAEKWGQKMLSNLKVNFSLKEKSEEGFRDMLICTEQYIHIFPDGSKLGFGVDIENPKNVWSLKTENKKYTRDAYAAGTVHIMEFGEILHKYPFLTKDEVDHLKKQAQTQSDPIFYDSPLVKKTGGSGSETIDYHTWDPYLHEERMRQQAMLMNEELDYWMETGVDLSSFGNMFVVVKAYWESKKKIGKLTYIDEEGELQVMEVDENYKTIPEEVSIEWGYINQWYEGLKIGNDVYYVQPLEILPYCPIIGLTYGNKNTPSTSLVDMAKSFQMIVNLCMNQLWEHICKEKGPQFVMNKRWIPGASGGNNQDAIQEFEDIMLAEGMIYIDDSPENSKVPSGFNGITSHDLSRTAMLRSRLEIAREAREMCGELLGISRQRQGETLATETATSVNTALTQSYAATEPYFMAQEYLWQQVYQAILDAALYIETRKPESTIHNITDGTFSTFSRGDLSLRDLQVFVIPRGKEQEAFKALQSLAQPMLQNEAPYALVAEMFLEQNSTRQQMEHIKAFDKWRQQLREQEMAQSQQQLEMQQQQMQAQMEQAEQQYAAKIENDNLNKELDRINKKEVALISALGFGEQQGEDLDGNGIPDIYQMSQLNQGQQKIDHQRLMDQQKGQREERSQRHAELMQQKNIELQEEKIKVQKQAQENQMKIAKMKSAQKPKTPKKK